MSEEKVIHRTIQPLTHSLLVQKLREIGLEEGMTVIVHSSMSSLGWVCGGPVAVIQALQDVLTTRGTLVMPTHTPHISHPKEWTDPEIPESWWKQVYEEMPAYDVQVTPTRGMGQIAETFRTMPAVRRSAHPRYSFAAWGQHRDFVIQNHLCNDGMGENSPLGKIFELDGSVLLLGTKHESNTSMHLGEHRSGRYRSLSKESPVMEEGERVWKVFHELDYNDAIFNTIGQAFSKRYSITQLPIGNAQARLMKQQDIVTFTAAYIQENQLN